MFSAAIEGLFLIPAAVLAWRIIVTKSRALWLRAGAAAAVMMTIVGALVVGGDFPSFAFKDWRGDIALLAAMSGSLYLLMWSLRKHSNRRHRTLSMIAALLGLVPVVATVASALLQER